VFPGEHHPARFSVVAGVSPGYCRAGEQVSVPAKQVSVPAIVENKGVQQILQFWAETTMTWGWIAERPAIGT